MWIGARQPKISARVMRPLVLALTLAAAFGQVPPPPQPLVAPGSKELGACYSCRQLVTSFRAGMQRTARGKFEGGDAAWEEEKLRSYSRSEVRLVEIQEHLCSDLKDQKDRCHSLAESSELHLEEWWFKSDPEKDDLFEYLCIEKLEHCCPIHHYGKNCSACPGSPDKPCSGNGKCKGDGTRKGNGECLCDYGYVGALCSECAEGYYEAYKDDAKVLCSPCHKACKGGCTGSGIKHCEECDEGWTQDSENGCVDVNECLGNPCSVNNFCVNSEGSYKCLMCDRSCSGCSGDGPDMCNDCANGYMLKDDMCVDSSTVEMSRKVNAARYLTYFGLCLTICIIFQKSTILAGFLGLMVALYISVSEYMLANDLAGPNPMIDPSNIDLAQLLEKAS